MLIIPGPSSDRLAQHVSSILGIKAAALESRIFPDGDSYFRIEENVSGEDVAVIQSTYPSQDRNLIQLFLLIDGLRDLDCGKVYAIVPYLAYMRQDKRFLDGELISARAILNLFKCLKVENLITIDIHNKDSLTTISPSGIDLSAMPLLADWIRTREWTSPLVIAPDKGASQRAQTISESLGTDYAVGRKTRDRQTGKVTAEFERGLKVKGRVAVIVDDTIARGDTVIKTAEILLDRGATEVSTLCTHGLFLDNAAERIRNAGVKEIVSTDTVPTANSKISVAPIIADALRPRVSQKVRG